MIKTEVKLDLSGLDYVRKSVNNVIIRKAINKAAVPVKDAVIGYAPSRRGYLRQSIRIKSKFYQATKTWAVIVGPSTAFKRSAGRGKTARVPVYSRNARGKITGISGFETGKAYIKPSRYAHLVEKGTKTSRPHPFLRPALAKSKQRYTDILCAEVRAGIEAGLLKSRT